MNRLRERYSKDVMPALTKEFGYTNVMAVPKITKVVVNMGLGEGTQNAKIVDTGAEELGKCGRLVERRIGRLGRLPHGDEDSLHGGHGTDSTHWALRPFSKSS